MGQLNRNCCSIGILTLNDHSVSTKWCKLQKNPVSGIFAWWKCLVEGQRTVNRLVKADRKAMVMSSPEADRLQRIWHYGEYRLIKTLQVKMGKKIFRAIFSMALQYEYSCFYCREVCIHSLYCIQCTFSKRLWWASLKRQMRLGLLRLFNIHVKYTWPSVLKLTLSLSFLSSLSLSPARAPLPDTINLCILYRMWLNINFIYFRYSDIIRRCSC